MRAPIHRTGNQQNWVSAQPINMTAYALALHFLARLFPHLSNEEVEREDLQGPFELEHSIILLSLCSDK